MAIMYEDEDRDPFMSGEAVEVAPRSALPATAKHVIEVCQLPSMTESRQARIWKLDYHFNNHTASIIDMAAASVSNCCARAASIVRSTSIHPAAWRVQSSAPLYLDFLAPSWRSPIPSSYAARTLRNYHSPQPLTAPHLTSNQRRTLTTTSSRQARAITNPRKDDDGNDMGITITPRAAHRLQSIAEKDANPNLALRVSVESGGCHGFQYLVSLTSTSDVDATEDTIFENEEVAKPASGEYKAKVVMDEPSLELLKGSKIDYTMELIGSSFQVTGIPGAKSSCGCGTSFDVAA